jgi:tetratricopeptide (TPR) repeat protein
MGGLRPHRPARARAGAIPLLLGALVLGLAAEVAHANDPPREEDDRRARELFLRGEDHYAAGRYEKAAGLYEEAYELSRRPELLFNIANCFERLGDYDKAAAYLRRYLRSPRARDVVSVRERIKRLELAHEERQREIERRLDEERKRRDATEGGRLSDREPEGGGGGQRDSSAPKAAYILLAGGGAGLVGAVIFGVAAVGAGRDADNLCGEGGLCPTTAESALEREKRFALLADVSAGVGLVAAGAGAYLLFREARDRDRSAARGDDARVVPIAVPGGAGIGVAGQF